MGFQSYRGGFKVGAGFKPDGDSGFPLIESCDIQVTEEGMRLDEYLENLVVGENLDPEISEQEELVEQIKNALDEKANAIEENMVGTWVFNDVLNAPSDAETFELEFIANANSNSYTGINISKLAPNMDFPVMTYIRAGSSVYAYAFNDSVYDDLKPYWQDDAYKTIEIVKEPDIHTATWIRANAKKSDQQQEDDARLKTKSKRIVDAINELKDKIDEGGTSENTLLNITVSTDVPTTMSAIITAIEEAGGDVSNATFVSLTGYISGFVAIKFNYCGGNKYKVECVDINNVTKIYNPETDNVIDVTATRIEDFLSYTVNSGGGTGVEQIKCIDTWASGVRELYADNGIYWSEGFELYNQTELTGDVVAYGDITHRVPIVPGNNVTFEIDAENEVVKINAIGGSSGTGENSIVGTWVFNESITNLARIAGEDKGYAVNFTSYCPYGFGNEYTTLSFRFIDNCFNYNRNGPSVTAYDFNTSTWADEQLRTITILSQTDDEEFIEWLNTNATKQEENNADGGASFALPMIRFANCTLIGDEEIGDLSYRFTVENLGGGTLQVGDKLQICCKRTYPNKKQKLRMMEEYIITEDDINQKFLKIEVNPSEEGVQKWLYRNNRIGNSSLSAMYFRLKRVTAYGKDDRECNAIFSNIEEVWKTYTLIEGTPSPYSLKIK